MGKIGSQCPPKRVEENLTDSTLEIKISPCSTLFKRDCSRSPTILCSSDTIVKHMLTFHLMDGKIIHLLSLITSVNIISCPMDHPYKLHKSKLMEDVHFLTNLQGQKEKSNQLK